LKKISKTGKKAQIITSLILVREGNALKISCARGEVENIYTILSWSFNN
jgi:hypothetical protein